MRRIDEIILHCSATERGKDFRVADIDRWHRARGFRKVGYHYVIDIDGTVEAGRKESEIGAHCSGRNKHSIGICYVGGLSLGLPTNTLHDNPSQLHKLCELLSYLMKKYSLGFDAIRCHNEFANKACPCFHRDYIYKVLRPIIENCI